MHMTETVLLLRTCRPGGGSYNGFRWPLTVGAVVEAQDWDPTPRCGGGLHGLLRGEGDGTLLDWSAEAVWLAVEADVTDVVDLCGKAKARRVTVRAVGARREVTDYVIARHPGAAVVGATVTGGHDATVTGGDRATVTGGDRATVTGGDRATVTGGDGATVTGGHGATVTGGDRATVTGGDRATVTGGHDATVTGGDRATVTGGDGATVTGGDRATVTGGHDATVTGGHDATVTGGDRATVTGGHDATVTGGDRATVTGGDGATVTGGDGATVSLRWWDTTLRRWRLAVGYPGEDGVRPGTPYRLDERGRFVAAEVRA